MSQIILDPKQIQLSNFKQGNYDKNEQLKVSTKSPNGMSMDAFCFVRDRSDGVVCLMPSAQPSKDEVINPVFHRWSWYNHLTTQHIISLSDPALYKAKIPGTWFMSGAEAEDILYELSSFIEDLVSAMPGPRKKIIFYGSSMGGFGALMLASMFEDAEAVVEVPQLDFRNYPITGAIKKVESDSLNNQSIYDLHSKAPERVSVLERFKLNGRVPSFTILTNSADAEFSAHVDFMRDVYTLRPLASSIGDTRLQIVPEEIGHKPLSSNHGINSIKDALKKSIKYNYQLGNYRQLIEQANAACESIKYIRTGADTQRYQKAVRLLSEAAQVNGAADWPLRKLCNIHKLWTNSFNMDILSCALNALSRAESLEAFIYACRAYVYNFPTDEAMTSISCLMKSSEDKSTKNIGNIFLGILEYDLGNFEKYTFYIKQFLQNKSPDFAPYIAIPVSTVYTENKFLDNFAPPERSELLGVEIDVADMECSKAQYLISTSCDQKYFEKYGEFILKSFSKLCSDEANLHLIIINGEPEKNRNILKKWSVNSSVYVENIILSTRVNLAPMASLARFLVVNKMLLKYDKPVLVMDLDTVIKAPMSEFITSSQEFDVVSRILDGVAPWETYTGGFALFNPSLNGKFVARNIAFTATRMAKQDTTQWWIDQNCFEAGIRAAKMAEIGLNVGNSFNSRNRYCEMPVGNGDAKLHTLRQAIKKLRIEESA